MYKAVIQPRLDFILLKVPKAPEPKSITLTESQKNEFAKDFFKKLYVPLEVVSVGPDVKGLESGDKILLRENSIPFYFPDIECEEGFHFAQIANYQVVAKVIVLD